MKTLSQFVSEARKSVDIKTVAKWFNAEKLNRDIMTFLSKMMELASAGKKSKYSLTNKEDAKKLYAKLVNNKVMQGMFTTDQWNKILSALNIKTSVGFATALAANIDEVNSAFRSIELNTNESAVVKEYKRWKESSDYTPLEDYNPEDSYEENEDGRAFIIYYRWDPSNIELCKVTRVKGVRGQGGSVDHQLNLARIDWRYETGFNYYTAYTCLVDYYRSAGKDELQSDNDIDLFA